jgi:hypothetical protein
LLGARAARAQTQASFETGASYVAYRGFLPSAAFSLSPSLERAGRRWRLAADGSWLVFESGNTSLQGEATGSLLLPAAPRVFAQFDAEVGGSRYASFASFAHALARARLGFVRVGPGTAWISAAAGVTAADSAQGLLQGGAAFRLDPRLLSVTISGTGTSVAGFQYADLTAALSYGRAGEIQAAATLGARANDPDGDAGPYVDATLSVPLGPTATLVLGGGRFAADLVRGNIAGHYLTAALRIATPATPRAPRPALPRYDSLAGGAGATLVAAALEDVRCDAQHSCTLVFHAVDATALDVMGDFTDWQPVALTHRQRHEWSITLPIVPGRHRLNVRIDGGAWGIPAGVTPADDDFEGLVGTVVVPE